MSKKKRANVGVSCLRGTISQKRKKRRKCLRKRIRALENSLIHELSYELKSDPNVINTGKKKYLPFTGGGESNLSESVGVGSTNDVGPSIFNKTIDLCGDESLDSVIQQFSSSSGRTVDLSKDSTEEVVIVNENLKSNTNISKEKQLTVINLDDEDEQRDKKPDKLNDVNDDVLVIGTYRKTPLSSSTSNKINDFFKCCVQVNKKPNHRKKARYKFNRENNRNIFNTDSAAGPSRRKHIKLYQSNQPESKVGENVYSESLADLPKEGLRPIIIDGSNVAFGNSRNFSCKRLEICIKYFKERGHKVTAFVPQFRTQTCKSDDPELLNNLVQKGDVILTPSKRVDGKNIVPYDDRFIVQTAVLQGGIIVTRDNYRDLLLENPAWAETINYRTLPYTWVDNVLMFPKDPLGEKGPSLEEFLRFN